jgi:hypothetical protein
MSMFLIVPIDNRLGHFSGATFIEVSLQQAPQVYLYMKEPLFTGLFRSSLYFSTDFRRGKGATPYFDKNILTW